VGIGVRVKTGDVEIAVIAAAGLLALAGRGRRAPTSDGIPWAERNWQWPVPDAVINGVTYPAVISNPFRAVTHLGVDVMYRRRNVADRPEYPPGGRNGSTMHFAPPSTPILAAADGRVWSCERTPRGWAVVVDHGAPFATFCTHLETVAIEPHRKGLPTKGSIPTILRAGDQIGTMGWSPLDGARLRHLHFAVWYLGAGDRASVDPARAMAGWRRGGVWSPP